MPYLLKLKGDRGWMPLSDQDGSAIKKQWTDDNVPAGRKIDLGHRVFEKRKIDDVKYEPESSAEKSKKGRQEGEIEYMKTRKRLLNLSPAQRARDSYVTEWLKVLWRLVTREKAPSEDTMATMQQQAELFYNENKKRILPDPAIILAKQKKEERKMNVIETEVFNLIIEESLRADVKHAQRI